MTAEVLSFLGGAPRRIGLFEAVEAAISACGESGMSVQTSQISWGNPKKFAFLSLPVRIARERPEGCLVLTFGLGARVEHPRIGESVEPYPGRWTHHVVLTEPDDVDEDVRGWLLAAYEFARTKGRRR